MPLLLLLLVASAVRASPDQRQLIKDECSERVAACSATQRYQQRKPVCGTDNLTYINRCHLLRAQCQGVRVELKRRGSCKDMQQCWADLRYTQRFPRPPQVELFAPTCLKDGSYAPVQCHEETGYCWCVTPTGRPVPNTSVRHARPTCGRRGKSGTRRRSSPGGRKHKKVCGRNDRSTFNSNLIESFRADYSRNKTSQTFGAGDTDRAVLDWKFSILDGDNDTFLSKSEYGELRQLVRKAVKPRRCAKMFARLCDLDMDRRISREEWTACLALDFNYESQQEGPGRPSKDEGEWIRNVTTRALLRKQLSQLKGARPDTPPHQILQGSMPTEPGVGDDLPDRKQEPEANDCLSDRQSVLEEQKLSTSELYIPECTPDGRYKKIQCYNSTGYCWCVYEDTGNPIPGTSIKDQNPNCDIVPPPTRPMSGCPEPRKQMFLKEFMDYMKKKMKSKNSTESATLSIPSGVARAPDEQVATWMFHTLDKNKSKLLERKEWKSFRTLVTSQRQLSRCGKRLPRYCDVNHDHKISLTEWLNCLSVHQSNARESPTIKATNLSPSSSNRTGNNPLMLYLIPE